MDIEMVRDIVIIISGISVIALVIGLLVIVSVVLSINKRFKELAASASDVMDKLQDASEDLQLITSYARQEVAVPLAQLAGFVQGLGQSLQSFIQMFRKF